ncbi:hypothetical protein L1887_57851 [Cichorium endivia]|nr:hypothetical protein L1887_57851 [Cichorium endivia]
MPAVLCSPRAPPCTRGNAVQQQPCSSHSPLAAQLGGRGAVMDLARICSPVVGDAALSIQNRVEAKREMQFRPRCWIQTWAPISVMGADAAPPPRFEAALCWVDHHQPASASDCCSQGSPSLCRPNTVISAPAAFPRQAWVISNRPNTEEHRISNLEPLIASSPPLSTYTQYSPSTMSLLRTTVAGVSRSSGVLRTTSASVRHLSTSRVNAAARDAKDPQLGDYPDLPFVSLQQRKYSPKWWDTQEKRNFGETLHEQDDVLSVWAPDVHAVPASSALRQFIVAIGVVGVFGSIVYAATPEKPALPRTYPRDGLAAELGGEQVAVSTQPPKLFVKGDQMADLLIVSSVVLVACNPIRYESFPASHVTDHRLEPDASSSLCSCVHVRPGGSEMGCRWLLLHLHAGASHALLCALPTALLSPASMLQSGQLIDQGNDGQPGMLDAIGQTRSPS